MTKAERIKAYNELYPGFNITGIKKMTEDEIESRIQWGGRSLRDVYKRPSDAKLEAKVTDREYNTQNAKEIE